MGPSKSSRTWRLHFPVPSTLVAGAFFGSTAPQAFFRPDRRSRCRRAQGMSRLAALQRPPQAWPLHARARRQARPVGRPVHGAEARVSQCRQSRVTTSEVGARSMARSGPATTLYSVGPTGSIMMKRYASAAKLRGCGPCVTAMRSDRAPPPRPVIGRPLPSEATGTGALARCRG